VATALSRKPRKSGAGRAQRKATATGLARDPDLANYYRRRLPDITPGEFDFTLDLLRGRGAPRLGIDDLVESFEWVDEEAALTGSVQLRRPDPARAESLPVKRGYQVRCRVRWGGKLFELWTMRIEPTEATPETGQVSVPLKDDLDLTRRSRRHWIFRKTKRRPHGYFGHDALRIAARREGIRLGTITKCTKRMPKIDVTGTFLDLATTIYSHEHTVTGRKFILRMRNGRFEAVHYTRNKFLYVLAEEIRSATLQEVAKTAKPATVITGTGRIGKGKDAKKVRHTEYRRDVVRRFGYAHKTIAYGRVDSLGDLKSKVQRDLAKQLRVDNTGTVQVQGIPFIRRGDGARVVIPSDGFVGAASYVFTTAVRHQVQGGTYTTELDFTQEDPFLADKKAREKAARAKARRKRKKKAAA
jgi:hypothetical protein